MSSKDSNKGPGPLKLKLKLRRSSVSNERRDSTDSGWRTEESQSSWSSSMETDENSASNNIPVSVMKILNNCLTPDKDMEEMLFEGLMTADRLLPCAEAKESERTKAGLTGEKISNILRKNL